MAGKFGVLVILYSQIWISLFNKAKNKLFVHNIKGTVQNEKQNFQDHFSIDYELRIKLKTVWGENHAKTTRCE